MSDVVRYKDNVKVRKPQVCFGCRRVFQPGTIMDFQVIADGGEIWNTYLCKTCSYIASNLSYGDEFYAGDLRDEALEIEAHEANRRAET